MIATFLFDNFVLNHCDVAITIKRSLAYDKRSGVESSAITVVRCFNSSSIRTWWNANHRSKDEKYLDPFRASKVSSIRGSRYESSIVTLFTFLMSKQNL